MRSFIVGLSLFILSLSPSMAAGPCNEINTPPAQRVGYKTPGYEPVIVLVEVPVETGDVAAEARKGFVRFSLAARATNLRIDTAHEINTIYQCAFVYKQGDTVVRNDKILLKVRMFVDEELTGSSSYTLRGGIFLPQSLVAKKPHAETELESGQILSGKWDRVTYLTQVPLTEETRKGKKKSKRTLVPANKMVTVTRLILSLKR